MTQDWFRRRVELLPAWQLSLAGYLLFGGGAAWFAYSVFMALQTGEIEGWRGTVFKQALNPNGFRFVLGWHALFAVLSVYLVVARAIMDIRRLIQK